MTPEFEQYRIEQAEAWLDKVRKSVAYAARLEESAEAQYARADGLKAMDYTRDRVKVPATSDAIPDAVAAHIEMGEKFAAMRGALIESGMIPDIPSETMTMESTAIRT